MSIRKPTRLVPWIAGLALMGLIALTTLPSLAAPSGTKYYKYSVSPSSMTTPAQIFTVQITNTSPKQSSSNISSVSIVVPPELTISGSPTINTGLSTNGDNSGASIAVNGQGSANCVNSTGQQVSVCSIAPVKSTKTIAIDIPTTLNTDTNLDCGQSKSSGEWIVKSNTGSQLNGSPFDIDPAQISGTLGSGYPYPATTMLTKVCYSTVSGEVWRDHNNNRLKDSDEAGQSGWTVKAFDGATVAATAMSGSDGSYEITGLIGGKTYTVCEFAPVVENEPTYRGWMQSIPNPANTLCSSMAGAEASGYSVAVPAATTAIAGKDFFNVRTITIPGNTVTVVCDPLPTDPYTFTVGDGDNEPLASVTIAQDQCKPGEYVFESWISASGVQQVEFYPLVALAGKVQVTQTVEWVIDGDKRQLDLVYDDGLGFGFRDVLFCDFDVDGNVVMPGTEAQNHTTCLLTTDELATDSGVSRVDTIVTIVDGKIAIRGT